jgi:AmmeMemoRadiSam system protein A
VDGRLNGCIGSIEAREPLGHAAPRLALSAAFADPRLPALRAADLPHLGIEVSLLSSLEPMSVASRAELRAEIRPGVDGILIEAGERAGVFLPKVWEDLPDPDEFLDRLWYKAGLVPPTWYPGMTACRFTATVHAA